MKKYSQLFLLSSALLSVFSAQLTVQASEANNASKNSNPTTLASDVTVNVSGNSVSINYIRSQAQNPYTISHAVWSDENGQDDLKWYSASQTSTTVDLSQHSGYGTFHVHTYININGKMIGLNGTTFKVEKPANSTVSTVFGKNAQISFTRNKDQTNANILHAVWSDEKGQDDIKWYTAGQHKTEIDLSNHRGYGIYHVHTYENKTEK
ncbi:GBS Bsp-like repeat protein [Streptococcus constellatus subsp. pharyngis SK1060 = CCUG 46377]|uniref:GBS Bsp-like repeat protein n=1 Tax=Streptococcus constellatus subsp. pharyngis SK1060 = CCUG 46377 TaxID=1035184 RepID=F9P9Z3_STRCV|nr:GBS Bsp-like repeat protein [Streptococcus constellatus subsp. pharyngis SK1060 = CCUG 46377]